ncbi:MAG: hypothetical protein ABJO75_27720 [Sedimentitalea sp.]|uniref:hypothetical protein n=1 Tax=Sedimentitalea sp. TaxID=2048915 RepID=UPI0032639FE6
MMKAEPCKGFHSSREVIPMAVVFFVRYPLSLSNIEGLQHERGIEISRKMVQSWWTRFIPVLLDCVAGIGRSK